MIKLTYIDSDQTIVRADRDNGERIFFVTGSRMFADFKEMARIENGAPPFIYPYAQDPASKPIDQTRIAERLTLLEDQVAALALK